MCQQTVLRFCIGLKETFYNSSAFTLVSKYDKGAVVKNATMFGPVYHVAC